MLFRRGQRMGSLKLILNEARPPPFPPQLKSDNEHMMCLGRPHLSLTTKIQFGYRSEEAFMNLKKDYYSILEVSEDASLQDIKQSFYILAKQYHPDKIKGDQSFFKQLNEAYNVLSHPELKKQYDENRISQNSPHSFSSEKKAENLDYNSYSQMSRAEWAYYRKGTMGHNTVDYTNYIRSFDPEKDEDINFKSREQWNRAYQGLSSDAIEEENLFRKAVYQKFKEDSIRHKQARDDFYQAKADQIAIKVERILGKRVAKMVHNLISK